MSSFLSTDQIADESTKPLRPVWEKTLIMENVWDNDKINSSLFLRYYRNPSPNLEALNCDLMLTLEQFGESPISLNNRTILSTINLNRKGTKETDGFLFTGLGNINTAEVVSDG